jgi:hypothetical protein
MLLFVLAVPVRAQEFCGTPNLPPEQVSSVTEGPTMRALVVLVQFSDDTNDVYGWDLYADKTTLSPVRSSSARPERPRPAVTAQLRATGRLQPPEKACYPDAASNRRRAVSMGRYRWCGSSRIGAKPWCA